MIYTALWVFLFSDTTAMNRKLVRQLKTLQSIKPAKQWSESTREILLSQIKAQEAPRVHAAAFSGTWAYVSGGASVAFHTIVSALFAHPTVLAAALTVFVAGSTSAVYVAEKSVPGEPLYAIKHTKEQINLALVTDPDARAQLELDFVDNRLSELQEVNGRTTPAEEKNAAVAGLADTMARDLASVSRKLDSIKKGGEPHKVTKLANAITSSTDRYGKALAAATPSLTDTAVSKAIDTIDDAHNKALGVIIEKKDSAGISDEIVAAQIKSTIDAQTGKIEKIKVAMAALKETETKEMTASTQAAQKKLDEAKTYLEKKDYRVALERVSETSQLVQGVNQKIDTSIAEQKTETVQKQDAPSGAASDSAKDSNTPIPNADVHMKVSF